MHPHHIVYASRLAPGHDRRVFADVCRHAPRRNAERGIQGALLFDGRRFCQWLAGPAPVLRALVATIALDERHTDMLLRLEGEIEGGPVPGGWRAGTVGPRALDVFDSDATLAPGTVIGNFLRVLEGAERLG